MIGTLFLPAWKPLLTVCYVTCLNLALGSLAWKIHCVLGRSTDISKITAPQNLPTQIRRGPKTPQIHSNLCVFYYLGCLAPPNNNPLKLQQHLCQGPPSKNTPGPGPKILMGLRPIKIFGPRPRGVFGGALAKMLL